MPMMKRMTEAELVTKFVDNISPATGAARARTLAELVMRVEELPRASSLLDHIYG